MPLRRLTKLARTELQDEHAKLARDIKYFNSLLKDPKLLRGYQGRRSGDPQEARGWRRTKIMADEGTSTSRT